MEGTSRWRRSCRKSKPPRSATMPACAFSMQTKHCARRFTAWLAGSRIAPPQAALHRFGTTPNGLPTHGWRPSRCSMTSGKHNTAGADSANGRSPCRHSQDSCRHPQTHRQHQFVLRRGERAHHPPRVQPSQKPVQRGQVRGLARHHHRAGGRAAGNPSGKRIDRHRDGTRLLLGDAASLIHVDGLSPSRT